MSDEGFFLIKSIEQPLEVLKSILLSTAAKLLVIFGNHDFEIIRSDAFLVLFLSLYLVDNQVFDFLLGVLSSIKANKDLSSLAVEAISWYLFTRADVMFAHLEVLVSVLSQTIQHLNH